MNIEQAKAKATDNDITITDVVTLKGKRYFMAIDNAPLHSITVDEVAPGQWLVEGMHRAKPRASAIAEAVKILLSYRNK